VFVKPYTVIPADFNDVCGVLLRRQTDWLTGPALAAAERQHRLLVDAGFAAEDHFGFASMTAGPSQQANQIISVPLLVGGSGSTVLNGSPDCTLDAAWLAPSLTHLAAMASYPVAFSSSADGRLLHRVLEAAALHFIEQVAGRLLHLTGA
jgi:hypothetical protein